MDIVNLDNLFFHKGQQTTKNFFIKSNLFYNNSDSANHLNKNKPKSSLYSKNYKKIDNFNKDAQTDDKYIKITLNKYHKFIKSSKNLPTKNIPKNKNQRQFSFISKKSLINNRDEIQNNYNSNKNIYNPNPHLFTPKLISSKFRSNYSFLNIELNKENYTRDNSENNISTRNSSNIKSLKLNNVFNKLRNSKYFNRRKIASDFKSMKSLSTYNISLDENKNDFSFKTLNELLINDLLIKSNKHIDKNKNNFEFEKTKLIESFPKVLKNLKENNANEDLNITEEYKKFLVNVQKRESVVGNFIDLKNKNNAKVNFHFFNEEFNKLKHKVNFIINKKEFESNVINISREQLFDKINSKTTTNKKTNDFLNYRFEFEPRKDNFNHKFEENKIDEDVDLETLYKNENCKFFLSSNNIFEKLIEKSRLKNKSEYKNGNTNNDKTTKNRNINNNKATKNYNINNDKITKNSNINNDKATKNSNINNDITPKNSNINNDKTPKNSNINNDKTPKNSIINENNIKKYNNKDNNKNNEKNIIFGDNKNILLKNSPNTNYRNIKISSPAPVLFKKIRKSKLIKNLEFLESKNKIKEQKSNSKTNKKTNNITGKEESNEIEINNILNNIFEKYGDTAILYKNNFRNANNGYSANEQNKNNYFDNKKNLKNKKLFIFNEEIKKNNANDENKKNKEIKKNIINKENKENKENKKNNEQKKKTNGKHTTSKSKKLRTIKLKRAQRRDSICFSNNDIGGNSRLKEIYENNDDSDYNDDSYYYIFNFDVRKKRFSKEDKNSGNHTILNEKIINKIQENKNELHKNNSEDKKLLEGHKKKGKKEKTRKNKISTKNKENNIDINNTNNKNDKFISKENRTHTNTKEENNSNSSINNSIMEKPKKLTKLKKKETHVKLLERFKMLQNDKNQLIKNKKKQIIKIENISSIYKERRKKEKLKIMDTYSTLRKIYKPEVSSELSSENEEEPKSEEKEELSEDEIIEILMNQDIEDLEELKEVKDIINQEWLRGTKEIKKKNKYNLLFTYKQDINSDSIKETIKLNEKMNHIYDKIARHKKKKLKRKEQKTSFSFIGVNLNSIEEIEKRKQLYLSRLREEVKNKIIYKKYCFAELDNFNLFANAMNKIQLFNIKNDQKKLYNYVKSLEKYFQLFYYQLCKKEKQKNEEGRINKFLYALNYEMGVIRPYARCIKGKHCRSLDYYEENLKFSN